jgi:hypothetical protein
MCPRQEQKEEEQQQKNNNKAKCRPTLHEVTTRVKTHSKIKGALFANKRHRLRSCHDH